MISEDKHGFECEMRHDDEKHNFLLLAEYLFSFLVLLAFFKQPSHTKLQEEKLN